MQTAVVRCHCRRQCSDKGRFLDWSVKNWDLCSALPLKPLFLNSEHQFHHRQNRDDDVTLASMTVFQLSEIEYGEILFNYEGYK